MGRPTVEKKLSRGGFDLQQQRKKFVGRFGDPQQLKKHLGVILIPHNR
jgi:hypothetical protein